MLHQVSLLFASQTQSNCFKNWDSVIVFRFIPAVFEKPSVDLMFMRGQYLAERRDKYFNQNSTIVTAPYGGCGMSLRFLYESSVVSIRNTYEKATQQTYQVTLEVLCRARFWINPKIWQTCGWS